MLRDLIISPASIVITTLILWIVFFQLFFRVLKISDKNWKRLEYIWIFIGMFGLVSITSENKKEYNFNNSERLKNYLTLTIKDIRTLLNEAHTCIKYTKSEYSPDNFEAIQFDQDLICKWSKSFKIQLDSLTGLPIAKLDTISNNFFKFKTNAMKDFIHDFNSSIRLLNSELNEYKKYREEYESDHWSNFSRTFGVLMLMLAFSIRLSIATKNVKQSK